MAGDLVRCSLPYQKPTDLALRGSGSSVGIHRDETLGRQLEVSDRIGRSEAIFVGTPQNPLGTVELRSL